MLLSLVRPRDGQHLVVSVEEAKHVAAQEVAYWTDTRQRRDIRAVVGFPRFNRLTLFLTVGKTYVKNILTTPTTNCK